MQLSYNDSVVYPALLLYTALVLLFSWLCNSPSRFFINNKPCCKRLQFLVI